MSYWIPAPVWADRTAAVLASGPSMSAAVAASVAHLPRITVNSTYKLAPDADVIYAADLYWWHDHPEAADLPGIKATIEKAPGRAPNLLPGVRLLRHGGVSGYDPRPGFLRIGGNSGYQAVGLAAQLGAACILLYGFDMHPGKDGLHHWHGKHTGRCGNPRASEYQRWIGTFRALAKDFDRLGIEVINCTPGSALDCFPFADGEARAAA